MKKLDKFYFESYMIGVLIILKINVCLLIFDKMNVLLLEKGSFLLEGIFYFIGGVNIYVVILGYCGFF